MLSSRIVCRGLLLFMASFCAYGAESGEHATAFFQKVAATAGTPGHFIIMRHAKAPGTGDPAGFTPGDCRTQRNLDAVGRQQAARIGDTFRRFGIAQAPVYSSSWCRSLETATLLDIGPVSKLSLLDSFFVERDQGPVQTRALRQWLTDRKFTVRLPVLVTHQVNISALTNVYPASGELVLGYVSALAETEVLARLATSGAQ